MGNIVISSYTDEGSTVTFHCGDNGFVPIGEMMSTCSQTGGRWLPLDPTQPRCQPGNV